MVAGLLIVGFRGTRLEDATWVRRAIENGLRGVILFDRDQLTGRSRNVTSPSQVAALSHALRAAAPGGRLLVGVDEEGGVVTRLGPAHGFPALASEAEVGAGTTAEARRWARSMGATLAGVGVNLDFAPVVDLDVNPRSPAIGALHRSFSADPDVVVRMATIEVDALRAAGVLSVLKHFPGIGSSTVNTDFGMTDVTDTWTDAELDPFRRLIAAGAADIVMAGHVVNRHLDPDQPASLSRAVVTRLLRGELGWEGPVVTDDLQAAAISERYDAGEAAVRALDAGCDLLLFANQQAYDPSIVRHVTDTVVAAIDGGRLQARRVEEAWSRVEEAAKAGAHP